MKERGSIYDHFALSGSAWGAIWGRLSKNEFSQEIGFQKNCRFCTFPESDVGRFLRDVFNVVRILAWNKDGKWWEGHNYAFGWSRLMNFYYNWLLLQGIPGNRVLWKFLYKNPISEWGIVLTGYCCQYYLGYTNRKIYRKTDILINIYIYIYMSLYIYIYIYNHVVLIIFF